MRETARPRHFLQVRPVLCGGMQDAGNSKRVDGGRTYGVRDGQPEPGVAEEDRPRLQLRATPDAAAQGVRPRL